MQVIRLWNYLRGYVIIKVEGLTLERFLNLAATRDIYLWDIRRLDYTLLEMKVGIGGFKGLEEVVERVGCRVEIMNRNGLPFLLQRLKKRKMLGFGFFIFLAIILFLFSLIWDIQVAGNKRIAEEEIFQTLENVGIRRGIIKYRIDREYVEDRLLDEFEDLSFASVEFKGTRLVVEIKEQDLPPESIDMDTPCNIVATKKGVVLKTIAKNGSALVRKGDVVDEGDVLITGLIRDEDPEVEDMLVHAEGEVLARTVYTYALEEPIVKKVEKETGQVYEAHELRFGKRGIIFSKDDIPFEDYIEKTRKVKLFGREIDVPIKILVHEYREVEVVEEKQDIDALKNTIYMKAIEGINEQLAERVEVESKDVNYKVDGNMLSIHIVVEVIEDIGRKQPLT
ncbi:MAG TPA: sporulation protein YqfD [Tepidimicrobium sp.]|nr:sporulation protein YqfD [Tepidimicrobium sp.]